MNLIVFGVILIIVAAAFAVPVLRHADGHVDDAGAVVLGASILSIGLGAVNFVALLDQMLGDQSVAYGLIIALAPVAAGLLGIYVAATSPQDARRLLLIAAAFLVLAGIPAYLAFTFAAFAAGVAALLYLLGLVSPSKLLKTLDPRNY